MIFDTLFERSGLEIIYRWGNSEDCHFPLFPQLQIPTFSTMALLYSLMLTGAVGITLGYKFYLSTFTFATCYWYVLLLDKTYWNNHSYLFGLVSILLFGSSANTTYSIDSFMNNNLVRKTVPFWNYFILRFQFFLLYFMAGLKKTDLEWLGGYSMIDMGHHWVFSPFKLILTTQQIDFLIVTLVGFLLDLTLGFWLISHVTRPYAMIFSTMFHVMNSRLFSIGMFPYVCIAATPIFCDDDWPDRLYNTITFKKFAQQGVQEKCVQKKHLTIKQHFSTSLMMLYCAIQVFLPYSHCITKGYNNWTNGLYGYSWDMMIHSWNSGLVVLRVTDNANGNEYFIDPDIWTHNQRWNKHADMCIQYAHCLKNNLIKLNGSAISTHKNWPVLSDNISIYIDVWCSLNKRFQQRMFDPNCDLLTAKWSPFQKTEWLLPLMTESDEFRSTLQSLEDDVYSWSNYSDVLFVADFPGMHLENYLQDDLVNVTLSVLGGEVIYECESQGSELTSFKLTTGLTHKIQTEKFHKIYTIGHKPSLYMYTFINQTKEKIGISG